MVSSSTCRHDSSDDADDAGIDHIIFHPKRCYASRRVRNQVNMNPNGCRYVDSALSHVRNFSRMCPSPCRVPRSNSSQTSTPGGAHCSRDRHKKETMCIRSEICRYGRNTQCLVFLDRRISEVSPYTKVLSLHIFTMAGKALLLTSRWEGSYK